MNMIKKIHWNLPQPFEETSNKTRKKANGHLPSDMKQKAAHLEMKLKHEGNQEQEESNFSTVSTYLNFRPSQELAKSIQKSTQYTP